MRVLVSGRLQTGSYVNKDGQRVYTTEVILDDQEFADLSLIHISATRHQRAVLNWFRTLWSTRSELQDCAIWQLERKKSLLFLLTIQDLFQATL